jgi:hypothetical protein
MKKQITISALIGALVAAGMLWEQPTFGATPDMQVAFSPDGGSYNYSQTAARVNSENVLVLSNHPELAKAYLDNWIRVTALGEAFYAH